MNKKIAVFHNALDTIGGGEMIALYLTRLLDADLYTTNIDKESIISMGFEDIYEKIYSIGKIPKQAPFKQQHALWRFKNLNLKNKYDYHIIAGDWAMSGAINNKPCMWYAHTPLNEIWAFKDFIKKNIIPKSKHIPYDIWCFINQKLTQSYAKHIDNWVCASDIAKQRIKEYYNHDSTIIYPPVDTESFKKNINIEIDQKDYWLSVNRLAQNKKIEMQIDAFSKLPNENLIIVYDYDNGSKELEKYKNTIIDYAKPYKNITFINAPERNKLIKIYQQSKGFITTSINESFGTTAVEAMAAGKPVIAPESGGYIYTIKDQETGILIKNLTTEEITKSVNKISNNLNTNPLYYKDNCINRAELYSVENFTKNIKNIVYSIHENSK